MKTVVISILLALSLAPLASAAPDRGHASWYGETHRGRLMANGKKFNPDQLTAASWFYPLGSRVKVSLNAPGKTPREVTVKITDRGPAKDLVRDGRIIDLSHAAFARLESPDLGLIRVSVRRLR
jgi:rare lipoprotein A